MLDRLFDTKSFLSARYALDGLSARQAAIADNVANVNTPNYKRQEVPFEGALTSAVERALNPAAEQPGGAAPAFQPLTMRDTATVGRADGNNVDIESEMVGLAENTLRYQALTQYVGGTFQDLKAVINSK